MSEMSAKDVRDGFTLVHYNLFEALQSNLLWVLHYQNTRSKSPKKIDGFKMMEKLLKMRMKTSLTGEDIYSFCLDVWRFWVAMKVSDQWDSKKDNWLAILVELRGIQTSTIKDVAQLLKEGNEILLKMYGTFYIQIDKAQTFLLQLLDEAITAFKGCLDSLVDLIKTGIPILAFAAVTPGVIIASATPGLFGGAAISNGLALWGGGSIAAGGLGMIGGVFVLALGPAGLAAYGINKMAPKNNEGDEMKAAAILGGVAGAAVVAGNVTFSISGIAAIGAAVGGGLAAGAAALVVAPAAAAIGTAVLFKYGIYESFKKHARNLYDTVVKETQDEDLFCIRHGDYSFLADQDFQLLTAVALSRKIYENQDSSGENLNETNVPSLNLKFYMYELNGVVYIIIRGTSGRENLKNFFTDLNVQTVVDCHGTEIHAGFKELRDAVFEVSKRFLEKTEHRLVVFGGHSLG